LKYATSYLLSLASYLKIILIVSFLTSAITGQSGDSRQTRKKLTTSDFKGKPDESVDNLASTDPLISIVYHGPFDCAEKGKVQVKVETKISVGPKSWINLPRVKNQEILTALLSHEQGHYDMGAVLATEIKQTLSTSCFDKSHYQAQVDSTLKSLYHRYDSLQHRYDVDTDLMYDIEMQARWKAKIEVMLRYGRLS